MRGRYRMCYIYWLRVTYKHFRWTRVFPTHTHTNNTCNGKHLHFNKNTMELRKLALLAQSDVKFTDVPE